ncbi:MAG: nucleoside triphosphate pyrophosphohydrolase [Clostridia bacterium]|nr:nucleoside triphosphate pyrophosphohydrolase [Clostridia bacterium]
MKITLIGLGIVKGDIPQRAYAALGKAGVILARSERSEAFASLEGYEVRTLDDVFKRSRTFDTLTKNIAKEVLAAAKTADVCYCVDGSVTEDLACGVIMAKHKDTEVIDSVSKSCNAINLAGVSTSGVYCTSAYDMESVRFCKAIAVYDIDDEYLAGIVKEKLSDIYGEESECWYVRANKAKKIRIYEIDRQGEYDMTSAVVAKENPDFLKKDRYDYTDLEHMVAILRAPGGCPWDRVQTSESIKKNVIEEAYELADAIDRKDYDGIEEETGDIILQAAFHALMASEKGEFTSTDAITREVKKLIFRHEHVFGKAKATNDTEALGVWDSRKAVEKEQTTFGDTVLAVPRNFPACTRAQKVQKRAAKSGMDFLSSVSAAEEMVEETNELLDVLIKGEKDRVEDEAGDVLFSAVNVCRLAGVDCEEVLRKAVDKFTERFVKCEQLIIADGRDITQLDELVLNIYWIKAKDALLAEKGLAVPEEKEDVPEDQDDGFDADDRK